MQLGDEGGSELVLVQDGSRRQFRGGASCWLAALPSMTPAAPAVPSPTACRRTFTSRLALTRRAACCCMARRAQVGCVGD